MERLLLDIGDLLICYDGDNIISVDYCFKIERCPNLNENYLYDYEILRYLNDNSYGKNLIIKKKKG